VPKDKVGEWQSKKKEVTAKANFVSAAGLPDGIISNQKSQFV
jgi:hypothetical protein